MFGDRSLRSLGASLSANQNKKKSKNIPSIRYEKPPRLANIINTLN